MDLVINTPVGTGARSDGYEIRSAAVARGIPCITTMAGGMAAARAIAAGRRGEPDGGLAAGDLHRRAEPAGRRPVSDRLRPETPRRDDRRPERVTAPFGARPAPVTGHERYGAYVVHQL